ncbi:unnamed protein product [Ostreobium quekettii]|uniref:Uncharacterized protein n=1 Tax=Ostreobium quekettii TaxID=121088 RepID=A0A8S1IZ00_9CHLO|nr:unnamed protein product [Ostreobium quekettii]
MIPECLFVTPTTGRCSEEPLQQATPPLRPAPLSSAVAVFRDVLVWGASPPRVVAPTNVATSGQQTASCRRRLACKTSLKTSANVWYAYKTCIHLVRMNTDPRSAAAKSLEQASSLDHADGGSGT